MSSRLLVSQINNLLSTRVSSRVFVPAALRSSLYGKESHFSARKYGNLDSSIHPEPIADIKHGNPSVKIQIKGEDYRCLEVDLTGRNPKISLISRAFVKDELSAKSNPIEIVLHTSSDVREHERHHKNDREHKWRQMQEIILRFIATKNSKESGKPRFRLGTLLMFSGSLFLGYFIGAKKKNAVFGPDINTDVLPPDKKPSVTPLGTGGKLVIIDLPRIIERVLPRSAEMVFWFTTGPVKLDVCFAIEDLSSCLESFVEDESVSSLHIVGVDHQRILGLVLQQIFLKEGFSKFSMFHSIWMITLDKK